MGRGGGWEVTYSHISGAGPVMLKGEATTQLAQISSRPSSHHSQADARARARSRDGGPICGPCVCVCVCVCVCARARLGAR